MALAKEAKQELIDKFGTGASDTGSTRVQVAMLTERINQLTEHLRTHSHDHHSRRGLLKLVGRRRRFLNYMQRTDLEGYRALIKELGLRRSAESRNDNSPEGGSLSERRATTRRWVKPPLSPKMEVAQ